MDRHTSAQRRRNMKAIKNKNTKIEIVLRKALWAKGFRYRKNYVEAIGKPDIAFPKHKIAIFCDSEFWHGHDWEIKKKDIKTNRDFWIQKIETNMKRDTFVTESLEHIGWTVIRFWGRQIIKEPKECIDVIEKALSRSDESVIP